MGKERGEGRGGERAPCVCDISIHAQRGGSPVPVENWCVLLLTQGARAGKGREGTGVGVGGAEGKGVASTREINAPLRGHERPGLGSSRYRLDISTKM